MVHFDLVDYKPTHSLNDFEFLQDPKDNSSKLGHGSLATVVLAREKRSGSLLALKKVDLDKIQKPDLQNLENEIQIHKTLCHPNIIKFHGYMKQKNMLYLILDYAENGNLYTYLRRKKKLSEKEVFKFFHQTCLAIDYLHQNNIIHRDIKPENLLLDKNFNIKVCDFGWSDYNIDQKRNTFCGTYEYMAPEIVNEELYDHHVDIWALGILLYELVHNKAPYQGRSLKEVKKSLLKLEMSFDFNTHQDAKLLIEKILNYDPAKRMKLNQIFASPWVIEHLEREEIFRKSIYKEFQDTENNKESANQKFKIFGSSTTKSSGQSASASTQHNNSHPEDRKDHSKKVMQLQSLNSPLPVDPSFGMNKGNFSLSTKLSLNVPIDEKKSPRKLMKKKSIFDENILSPKFNEQLNHIIGTLNSSSKSFLSPKSNQEYKKLSMNKIQNYNIRSQTDLNLFTQHSQNELSANLDKNEFLSTVNLSSPRDIKPRERVGRLHIFEKPKVI